MAGTVNQSVPAKVDDCVAAPLPWLFALRCLVCGEHGYRTRDLCDACHADLPWQGPACLRCALPMRRPGTCGACLRQPPVLDAVHAVFEYAFPVDRMLPRLKFHQDLASARVLVQCMVERCARLPRPDAIVPIPLHRSRLRQRGYDQALELARPLARALHIPLDGALLRRRRATSAQSRLDAGARQHNLDDAFAIGRHNRLPAHVVLVDDVMTTGVTLHAAARTLRDAGVQRVDAWVCARVA